MVRRRLTIPEARWPETQDFVELAIRWQNDAIKILWSYVWLGWDSYCTKVLSKVDLSEADDQLERMITQDLELDVRRCMSGYEPFMIQHERFEEQGRSPSPARPKQPDLTFVLYEYRTIKYPLEAKVLRSDSDVKAYVEEITENFLKFRYAPFTSEGGMLGYLLRGNTTKAFDNIAAAVPCTLADYTDFIGRDHKTSDHDRNVPVGKTYPAKFRCHHLLLQLTKKDQYKKGRDEKQKL